MKGLRREGREPGRFASSTLSDSSVSVRRRDGEGGSWPCDCGLSVDSALGALGWLMAFWPVMTVPFVRPAEM